MMWFISKSNVVDVDDAPIFDIYQENDVIGQPNSGECQDGDFVDNLILDAYSSCDIGTLKSSMRTPMPTPTSTISSQIQRASR